MGIHGGAVAGPRMAVRGRAREIDAAFYIAALFDHQSSGVNFTDEPCALPDVHPVGCLQLAFYATPNLDIARVDVGPDSTIRGNREAMLEHLDRSLHFSVDGQVLPAQKASLHNDTFPQT